MATDGQMDAVDALIKAIKAAEKGIGAARDAETKPLHEAWKAEVARWKPTVDDLGRIKNGLVAAVGEYRKAKAAAQERAAAKARAEAAQARAVAEAAVRTADPADIEAQRIAAAKVAAAEVASAEAAKATKAKVKGLRVVHHHAIDLGENPHRAALAWIAVNDRDAVTEFIEAYVAKHYRLRPIDGVRTWETKEAF